MANVYQCPHCTSILNPGHDIVLRGEHGGKAGLVLLSPKLGDYAVVVPPDFHLAHDTTVDFSCPVCGKSLTSRSDKHMAEVVCVGGDGSKGVVAFSRSYGHHATYFVGAQAVRSYGEHAVGLDVNFWGAGPS